MYALLNGESSFPDSAADAHILLPDNKSVIFPLKLFKIPKYRKRYDAARTAFTTEHGGQGQQCINPAFVVPDNV